MQALRHITVQAIALLAAAFTLTACTPRALIQGSLADELAAQGRASESDLDLAREASAFYLKLSESVLGRQPGHRPLAEAVASGFAQYAYAFVSSEADRIESTDARAAERLRQRAARLYRRAHSHAIQALETHHPGFVRALANLDRAHWPVLDRDEVGLAYWAAAAWGGWISLAKDDPDTVADLPQAVRLAELAWLTDSAWGDGALSALYGSFEAARPGGGLPKALGYFDLAIIQSAGRSAGPLLAKAEGYAQPAGDRGLFESLLREALAIRDAADSPLALQNEVMRRRAQWLLDRSDDLF